MLRETAQDGEATGRPRRACECAGGREPEQPQRSGYRASSNAISASAPGSTWTKRIRLLAVAAP